MSSENDIAPRVFKWSAERSVMVPLRPMQADRQYVDGEEYRLGVIEERSGSSHRHYFAAINDAWHNLSEEQSQRFPTSEHLRRYALIKAGYADVQEFAASSHAEALRIATYIGGIDSYAVVAVKGNTVQRFTAKSQSYRSMGKPEFNASKDKVLEIISAMIGVTPAELAKAAA